MLMPRSHAWTRTQRRLILACCITGLGLSAAGIYNYERYFRGPSDAVFFGTWRDTTPAIDSTAYYRFKPDGTFDLIMDGMGSIDVMAVGKWYAGGRNIYLRLPLPEDGTPVRSYVWHIADISPDRIFIRETHNGAPVAWERVHDPLPIASNQAMELITTRRMSTLKVATPFTVRAVLALGSDSSSYSR